MEIHDPEALLRSLCTLSSETSWLEFKENNFSEDTVGQYVSSLANSAMLEGKDYAYLIFGVRNSDHAIVGTDVDLFTKQKGNEEFVFWLTKLIEPKIVIRVFPLVIDDKRVEILCIKPGYQQPVKFKKIAYIRIGTNQQPLSNHPERERALWQITSRYSFENSFIGENFTAADLDNEFNYDALVEILRKNTIGRGTRIQYLKSEGWVKDDLQGKFQISTLLAILCARNLNNFPFLSNKGVRLVVYRGKDKSDTSHDFDGQRGYLISFQKLLQTILQFLPIKEIMVHGIRKNIYDFPELAIREFLANAIVHQDFTANGSRILVEVFDDKIRFTNPGEPLIAIDRFIDSPSKTRNASFAKIMRDAGLCEQRGSGVDKAIQEIERAALPPPLIQAIEGSTVVTIFGPRRFADMTPDERIRACFQHACLCFERGSPMSNASLRLRLGLSEKQYPQVSNVIKDAIAAGRIKPRAEDQPNRNARYVPFYAEDM